MLKKNKEGMTSLLKKAYKVRSLKEAIKRENKISIIAEIKQASPSAGIIRKDFSHLSLAKSFEEAGAKALSVLTEEEFFLGKGSYIEEIRSKVNIPVLRKDFIIDEIQVLESRALGADAVLLIAQLLDKDRLKSLYEATKSLGMEVIVEVHSEKELRRVLKLPIEIIGINNRNLNTLKVDMERVKKLVPFISQTIVTVSESGVKSLKDMLVLKGLDINAALIGEAIMKEPDAEKKLRELNIDG